MYKNMQITAFAKKHAIEILKAQLSVQDGRWSGFELSSYLELMLLKFINEELQK